MRLKTVLNQCCDFQHFVIGAAKFSEDKEQIEIQLRARVNSKPICSGCEKPGSGYDRLPEKQVQFIPFWGYQVFFNYATYLANWAKEMSWKTVASRFRPSWQTVFRAVEMVVAYSLANRCVKGVESIGIDEVSYQSGHQYMTLVYQIDKGCRRLL